MEFKEEGLTKATYSSSFSFGKTNQTDWVLYYCCIVDRGANQSKLPSLLKDLHRLLKDNYDPETFTEKTSINRDFTEAWYQTLDNYNLRPLDKKTGAGGQVISYAKVNKANEKVDELKVQLIDNVEGMIRNNKTAEELKANSNNLKEQAKIFERQASEVEKEVKKKNFWMFSLKWILIFGGIGIFLILAFILIYLLAIK